MLASDVCDSRAVPHRLLKNNKKICEFIVSDGRSRGDPGGSPVVPLLLDALKCS